MTISSLADGIELAELSKLINKRKTSHIQNYTNERIEHAVKNGGSLKAVRRRLGRGNNQTSGLKDKEDNVISNSDKMVKVAEKFYRDLCSSRNSQGNTERGSIRGGRHPTRHDKRNKEGFEMPEGFETLDWEQVGVSVDEEYLSNLRFAYDVVVLSNSGDELQSLINALDKQSKSWASK